MGSDGGGDFSQWTDVAVNSVSTFVTALLAAGVAIWLAHKERKAADSVRRGDRVYNLLRDVQAQAFKADVRGEVSSVTETLKLSADLKALGKLLEKQHPELSAYLRDVGSWFYESRVQRDKLTENLLALGRVPSEGELRPVKAEVWDLGYTHAFLLEIVANLHSGEVDTKSVEAHHARVVENLERLRQAKDSGAVSEDDEAVTKDPQATSASDESSAEESDAKSSS